MKQTLIAISAALCLGLSATAGFAASHTGAAPMSAASAPMAPMAPMAKSDAKAMKKQSEADYKSAKAAYHCPCHNSSFAADGKRDPKSPSARDLDSLPVKIKEDGQVWVKYQDFKTGDKEKKPA